MKYQEQLTPWVVYQVTPDLQRQAVIRFRRRNDADAYLKVLQQTVPHNKFVVSFESNHKIKDDATESELVTV